MENIASQIINWIKTYAENARVKGLVIGVSGGVDSAVVSTLCARTGLPTLCLEMPLANTRARIRMTTLYYFAGLEGYIVVGTGNKIEDFGVGFFTKYGDGGVDISPIADLMKSEVYKLAEYLHIPKSILKAKPSDGLFGDDRSDEDQLKASYDELEWAMLQTDQGKKAEEFRGREREVFEIYTRLNRANQHKIQPIPFCKIKR